jgi:hypothetical protein
MSEVDAHFACIRNSRVARLDAKNRSGGWSHGLELIGQTLPAGTNFDVQNQRFVVGASTFAFLDIEAFDLR